MTPESLVAREMLAAAKRKGGIAFIDRGRLSVIKDSFITDADGKLSYLPSAKYGVKPIFVSFGADNARTIIDNMALDDWASFCEVNQWR